jgi:hypothetical protein
MLSVSALCGLLSGFAGVATFHMAHLLFAGLL